MNFQGAVVLLVAMVGVSCEKEAPKPAKPPAAGTNQTAPQTTQASKAATSLLTSPTVAASPLDSVRSAFTAAGVTLPDSLGIALTRKTCQVLGFDVNAKEAIDTWKSLRAVTDKTGWYPLVVRDLNIEEVDEHPEATDPAETLKAAAEIDASAWLKEKLDRRDKSGAAAEGTPEPNTGFTVPMDETTGEPAPDVRILLVPTRNGWEVPAFVPFGGADGWNDCPGDAAHVAVLKAWYQRYGAELVTMSDDVLELQVARPPASDEAAAAIAMEQFAYCGDIVEQGVGSVKALAASIKACPIWYFWWD
jgi:hypothetical protein